MTKENKKKSSELFECFFCSHRALIWQRDYDFEDFGYEGEGIVQILHCANCGADVEYKVPFYNEEGEPADESTIMNFL